jgi:hypothetical protein
MYSIRPVDPENDICFFLLFWTRSVQGCQIFLVYQNGGKDTKLPITYPMTKMYQMAVVYSNWPKNIPSFSISRPFKIYLNWVFGLKINHLATLEALAERSGL